MTRLLHFADFHLGMENYGRLDPETGLSTRVVDFLRSLDFLVTTAIQNDVGIVLFAGDAFKTRRPSMTHQREFAKRIMAIANHGIPVILLAGNHDVLSTQGAAHTLEIFATLGAKNVCVSNRPELLAVTDKFGQKVQIIALPWVTRNHILAKDKYRGLSIAELDAVMQAQLVEIVCTGQNSLTSRLDPDLPTVLLAHGTVAGSAFGGERNSMLGNDLIIPNDIAFHPIFHYVALGHLHRHQVVSDIDPVAVYSGSMERVDFGEEEGEKGFVMVDIASDGWVDWAFVPTPTRRFVTVEVYIEDDGVGVMATILDQIAKHDVVDAIVRVRVSLPAEVSHAMNEREIRKATVDAAYVIIQRHMRRRERVRMPMSAGIGDYGPEELLAEYFKVRGVNEDRTSALMGAAREIMQEVDRSD